METPHGLKVTSTSKTCIAKLYFALVLNIDNGLFLTYMSQPIIPGLKTTIVTQSVIGVVPKF